MSISQNEESGILPHAPNEAAVASTRRGTFTGGNGWGWGRLGVAMLVSVIVRIRLLEVPLERDEGEYAYVGQLMLQGIPPYKLAYTLKLPGTHAAYAAIMAVFGETIAGIHLGVLAVNLATIALVFLLGRRLLDGRGGGVAAVTYAVLSVSPSVCGFAGHATHFVVLPVLCGALLLLRALNRQSRKLLFASGVLFGIGLLMKQPALSFILFGAGYLFYRDCRAHLCLKNALFRNVLFSCGAIVPLAITCILLWRVDVLARFWFWTVDYAREYGSLTSASKGSETLFNNIPSVIGCSWALWVIAGVGLIFCVRELKTRESAVFTVAFLGFSALAVCPGFYFREHYFILLLPSLSLLAGVAVGKVADLWRPHWGAMRLIPPLLFGAAVALLLLGERKLLFQTSPITASRLVYWPNPFPESIPVAEYLRQHTNPEDSIAVFGSEPQIYFYAHRHSATGYIYTYGLMERQKYALQMQREMIHEIELAHPRYVVFVRVESSWLDSPDPDSERLILRLFDEFFSHSYDAVGLVNIVSLDRTDYYLRDSSEAVPLASRYLAIYKRNSP